MMISSPSSPSRRRGFTLAEVVVALGMIAIILPVAMQGVTSAARASAHAKRVSEASELARMKLNEIILDADTTRFSGNGDFGTTWPDYQWQVTATSMDYSLYQVTVVVKWQQTGQEDMTSVSTLVYVSTTVSTGSTLQ